MGKLLVDNGKANMKIGILSVIMFVFGLSMVFPFVFMLSASFKPNGMVYATQMQLIPSSLYLDNYIRVFTFPNFPDWYLNSFKVVVLTIIFRAFFITMAAYAFARLRFPFKNALFLFVFSVWMVPLDTTIVSRYFFYKYLGIIDTHWAIILPLTFDVFMLFLIRQFFSQLPFELTESALIDGCSHFRIYYSIILPLAKPAILTMILFTFIWTWNNLTDPLVFLNRRQIQLITVGLQFFQEQGGANIAMQLAGATLGIIPPILLFSFTQKYFIQGIAMSGIKG